MAPAEDKFRPAGREPAETLQVNGGVPPVADRFAEYPCPTVPAFSPVVVMLSGAAGGGLIVIRNGFVADWLAESLTRAVKSKSPAVVGEPLIAPVADKVRPVGNAPAAMLQASGGVPPVADRFPEYACPTAPALSPVVVMLSGAGGAGLMVMRSGFVAD
jgi:hypothetical protein